MKTNSKKIIVSTLALAMGAALAGSISGSVAWYQYSTRANAEFQGVSAHCTENIEISIAGANNFHGDLTYAMVNTYLNTNRTKKNELRPVHTGALAADSVVRGDEFKKSPREGYTDPDEWLEADADTDFIDLPLELRVKDIDGEATPNFLAKPIYLTDVTLAAKQGSKDITDALRVGVMTKVSSAPADTNGDDDYATFAKSATAVDHFGPLNLDLLDGDSFDMRGYTFEADRETYLYGVGSDASYAVWAEDDYVREAGNTLKQFNGTALESVTLLAGPYAKLADLPAADENDGKFAYASDDDKFYTSDGSAWSVVAYHNTPVGGYVKYGENYFTYDGTTLTTFDATTMQAAATAITPVATDVNGVAVLDTDGTLEHGTALGSTLASTGANSANNLFVTLRIYLDGWQKIDGSAVWADSYIGAEFNVGLRFETTLHDDAAE